MNTTSRIAIFVVVFGLVNLSFIPLLSLYGLRVCPVLSIPGFGFGCYYSGIYVGMVILLNATLLFLFTRVRCDTGFLRFLGHHLVFTTVGIYLLSTAIALVVLQYLLHINHLSSNSRGPEILFFASFLLGITQTYGVVWSFKGTRVFISSSRVGSFQSNWFIHVARTFFPVVVAGGIIIHFLFGQSVTFNLGRTAPIASHDDFILQTTYLVLFLALWIGITYTFHFLSEKDQVDMVQNHLKALEKSVDPKYRSELTGSWGLWKSIIHHLNLFSQTFEERGRLLSAFSKFVTEGVAKEVLAQEKLLTTGITREMTVLMVDIRNFTSMSESLDPNQVVELLNEYFSAMLAEISKTQITVDKFIGDGILAYVESGTSASIENLVAVNASLKMLDSIYGLNQKLKSRNLPEIKIGIGIYRGPLVIGLIGTESKMQHTIIGDTVNRVARLESLCKELLVSIVLSGSVWKTLDVNNQKRFHSFGERPIKGINEPVSVYGGPDFEPT